MKLLSWNIMAGGFVDYKSDKPRPEKIDLIVKAIKDIDADFVSLVDVYRWKEVFSEEDLMKIFGYRNVYQIKIDDVDKGRKNGGVGITVMTNLDVIKFEKCWIDTRYCLKTTVNLNGIEVKIFSIYLDNKSENKRLGQIGGLANYLNPDKATVICGDLNSIKKGELSRWAKIIINLGGLYPRLKWHRDVVCDMSRSEVIKRIRDLGLEDADNKFQKTIPTKLNLMGLLGPFLRLDYCWTRGLKVNRFEVVKSKIFDQISDHYPIVAEIE